MSVIISVPNDSNLTGVVPVAVQCNPIPKSVSLYLNGTNESNKVGISNWSDPFSFSWDTETVTDGSHTLYAIAKYKSNSKVVSLSVLINNDGEIPSPEPPVPLIQDVPVLIEEEEE